MEATLTDDIRTGKAEIWERLVAKNGLKNFRDMGNYPTIEGNQVVSINRLFRSANPGDATKEDAHIVLDDKNICTWVRYIVATDKIMNRNGKTHTVVTLRQIDFRTKSDLIRPDVLRDYYTSHLITASGSIEPLSKATKSSRFERHRYEVDLDYRTSVGRFFRKHATTWEKLLGMQALTLTFWEENKAQLSACLKIIAEAPNGALINCMLGKDRTGALSSLVLLALDVPMERVAHDYSLTELYLDKNYIKRHLSPFNMDSDTLVSASKSSMQAAIAILVVKYGSVEGYFDSIGFDASWRQKIRANFLKIQPLEVPISQ